MDKKAIFNAKKCLIEKNLGGALNALNILRVDKEYVSLHERIEKFCDDYELMLSYMRNGYPDPSRTDVYLSALRRLD